jgi:hypothetical protein
MSWNLLTLAPLSLSSVRRGCGVRSVGTGLRGVRPDRLFIVTEPE